MIKFKLPILLLILLFLFGVQTEGTSHIVNKSQDELVAALKTSNESVMKALYTANFPKVNTYVLQNSGSAAQAKDIYQEAFIAVWKNVRNDKFTPQNESSLSGYLYRIAQNKWLDYLRSARHKKTISENRLYALPLQNDDETEGHEIETEKISQIMGAFGRLGKQCKHVLEQFYFKHKSYKDISSELDMKEASVRNQKYRCMQKLREMVQNSNNK